MHDPQTVAHEILYPWLRYGRKAETDFQRHYRSPFITIWHVDPEDGRGKCGVRGDDTCGWFSPPYSEADSTRIRKLGESQYSQIYGKQWALAEKKDYARVCYEPTAYDAIYWAWRAIKHAERKGHGWQYGPKRIALSAAELQQIFELYSSPVDNLRISVWEVKDAETCGYFFLTVYRCYLRFHRPWWQHPRWHVRHWKLQVHPWQTFRRWAFTRCAGCGKGFAWGESPISHQWDSEKPKLFCSEVGLYHDKCSGMTMKLHSEPAAGSA